MQNTGSLPNASGHDGVYIVDATAGQSSPLGRENGIFLAATRAGAATHRSISLPFGLCPGVSHWGKDFSTFFGG
jgi:hypothetical protein